MNRVTDALRDIDPAVWLRAALRDCADDQSTAVVFDSMRFEPDYTFLHDHGFVMIRVDAGAEARALRLADRGQSFDLLKDDLHPAEIELARASFDFTITNDGDVDNLHAQVRKIMEELRA